MISPKLATLAMVAAAVFTGCRSMDKSGASGVKDLQDGTNWCHSNLRSIDGTPVNVDYVIDDTKASPVWLNMLTTKGSANLEAKVVVIPYMNKGGQVVEGKDTTYTMTWIPNERKYTFEIPQGLEIQRGSDPIFYEFAFAVNNVWLKDPLSGKSNFRVDFQEINKTNHGKCVATKPIPAPTPPSATPVLQVQTGKMYKMDPAEVTKVVAAIKQVRYAFYEEGNGYDLHPGSQKVPSISETNTCLNAAPDRWSDLAAHYYSFFPGYSPGFFPNIRECYTYLVSPNTPNKIDGKKPGPVEAHQYCTYMPIDRQNMDPNGQQYNWANAVQNAPAFDQKYKAAGTPVGPFKWISKNQPDVFPFVMFATPCTIHPYSQQEVLNAVYDVDLKGKTTYTAADTDQVKECESKRPKRFLDPTDGTHCSYDMRKSRELAEKCSW